MRRRTRKLVGTIAMLAFVVIYALAIMALAQSRPLQQASGLVHAVFYVVAGMSWILPIIPLIKWMERRDD